MGGVEEDPYTGKDSDAVWLLLSLASGFCVGVVGDGVEGVVRVKDVVVVGSAVSFGGGGPSSGFCSTCSLCVIVGESASTFCGASFFSPNFPRKIKPTMMIIARRMMREHPLPFFFLGSDASLFWCSAMIS